MMNTLVNWLGKAEDLELHYDAGVPQNSLFLHGDQTPPENLPAIIYTTNENLREVSDVVWDKAVTKADRTDYLTAVACGAISGLIDIFYVGEFSLDRANEWGSEQTNMCVKKVAELNGFKGDDLSDAIKFMEKKFPLAADEKAPNLVEVFNTIFEIFHIILVWAGCYVLYLLSLLEK